VQSSAADSGPVSFAPQQRALSPAQGSTKLNVLRCMLKAAIDLGEKVVIVSTSTQMLDAAAQVCAGLSLPTARIDGSTAAATRQELVDKFNDTSPATGDLVKVFLSLHCIAVHVSLDAMVVQVWYVACQWKHGLSRCHAFSCGLDPS
jgi:hypothetical protein